VFVGNFENLTAEANVENYVRNSFIDQVRRGNRFKVVASKALSDAVLAGSIKRVDTSHVSYTESDVAKEDRVTMIMEINFEEIKTGKVIWASENFTGNEEYTVSSNTATTERNKRTAIRNLSDDMAEKAYRSIMSGF
jgi:outer membrane lipopolysaccharide assembly protein LptE/RlpB